MLSYKKDPENCFLDLKRAAISFYLNPKGKTWQIFLDHALKILAKEKKLQKFIKKIKKTEEKAIELNKKEIIYLADEILTWGILIRSKR